MIKGGYKIIDFKGAELSTTAVEISGIYNQIVDDYNKPIMVSGVIISGELQDDAYASVKVDDDTVALTVYDGVITVTDDDEVSFTSVKSNVELEADLTDITSKALKKASATTLTGDVNDATVGWAYYGSGATNLPSSGTFFIITLIHMEYKCQIAINKSTASIFVRAFAQSWTEWKYLNQE